jgi:hypothetical protein
MNSRLLLAQGETKGPSQTARALSLSLPLPLSLLSLSLLSAHRIIPIFCSVGGDASAREGWPSQSASKFPPLFGGGEASARELSLLEFSPSFAVWGGRLLIARGGNQDAFSRHQGQGARKDLNTTINCILWLPLFCFTSTFTTSSNMDTDPATTTPGTGNNTEDALVKSSLIGAQAAPDNDGVQIVPPPPAAASNHNKRKKSNDGDDQQSRQKKQRKLPAISKKRPAISDVDLEKQLNWVRNASLQNNVVDSSLQGTQAPDLGSNDCSDEDVIEVMTYFTMDVMSKRSSPWWEGFVQFIPIKHPTLYKEYILCKECSDFHKKANKGIVKVGLSQSTSNLRAHKKHHHPAEYETIAKCVDKTTIRSSGDGGLPKSITMMPGFSVKLKVKDSRLLYRTAAASLAIKEGIPFCTFAQLSFRRLFTSLNSESDRIVSRNRHEVRDSVIEMGGFAIEATKREIRNHQIAWTTDHWTGADKGTYTTVTAHWINNATWRLHSA